MARPLTLRMRALERKRADRRPRCLHVGSVFSGCMPSRPRRRQQTAIDVANRQFAKGWTDSPVECVASVSTAHTSDRLRLFRLGSGDQQIASRFDSLLQRHLNALPATVGVTGLQVKRQVNLPMGSLREAGGRLRQAGPDTPNRHGHSIRQRSVPRRSDPGGGEAVGRSIGAVRPGKAPASHHPP